MLHLAIAKLLFLITDLATSHKPFNACEQIHWGKKGKFTWKRLIV